MFTSSAIVQCILLLPIPIVLGFLVKQRLGLSWILFFGGALAFVSSYIFTSLIMLPGVLGLLFSSITQMGFLYLIYRFQLKTVDTAREALMVGLGLGGIEVILVVVFIALSVLQANQLLNATDEALIDLVATTEDISEEEVAPVKIDRLRESIDGFWHTPWYGPRIQPIQSVIWALPLRTASDDILLDWIAETSDLPEEDIQPERVSEIRDYIESFWTTPEYAPIIQPILSLIYIPIPVALAIIVSGAVIQNRWWPLMGATALHFLSQILPLLARLVGGVFLELSISLVFCGVATWFLRNLVPTIREQTQIAFDGPRKGKTQT